VILKWSWITPVDRLTRGVTDELEIASRAGGVSCEIWIVPLPGGQPLGGTTPVAADVAVVEPLVFFAVTATRSVWPMSATVGV
jgi:hypothetical protein